MAKKKAKKRGKKGETVDTTRPPWRAPPQEIIGMILQFLATDKASLRACSQAAREFRYAALSCLGRHLAVNSVGRVKECAHLVAEGAFQHIRSLDLGINDGRPMMETYWKDYLVILRGFARYRTLDRLWLSEVPFNLFRPDQKDLRETITALGSTVTELGLYGCRFSSYEETVSLIRSFPHCNSLFLYDCVTRGKSAIENAFAGLPEHVLSVKDLQLSSSLSNGTLIDISKLIEDAALDVGSLTSLVCDVGTAEKTQRIAEAVSGSPVEHFQVACAEPGGFQVFMGHLSKKWSVKSLTIGPQLHKTNTQFWEEAFDGLPPLPSVDNVTIVYSYPTVEAFNTDCWYYFDRLLTNRNIFPALVSVRADPSIRSLRAATYNRWWEIRTALRRVRGRGLMPAGW